jgi:thioredoxin reductase
VDASRVAPETRASEVDVGIVGAGPYGLAAAAHLRRLALSTLVIGEPMSFWRRHMPDGMRLRSPNAASDIGDPRASLSLTTYERATGEPLESPLPIERFIDYGLWVQQQVAPDVDQRSVRKIDRHDGVFHLTLADGTETTAAQVVVAAGIGPFAETPGQFHHLPKTLASHSSDHADLSVFAGRRVAVIGAGQSALESAALVREAGAETEVLARSPRVHFLRRHPWIHRLGPLTKLLYAPAEVGPAGLSRLVELPGCYGRLPRRFQDRCALRSLRPAGAAWLIPRLDGVPITTGIEVTLAERANGSVHLKLSDGSEREIDHALLATGFRVDISRYAFLSERLLRTVEQADGYPRLSRHFESSVPGLYFIGASGAWSFGPLMRFVAGTAWTARALVCGIEHRARMLNR